MRCMLYVAFYFLTKRVLRTSSFDLLLNPCNEGVGAGTPDDNPWGSLSSLLSRGKREDPGNEVGLRS